VLFLIVLSRFFLIIYSSFKDINI